VLILLAYTYFVLAIGFNVLSQVSVNLIGKKFTPTEPLHGLQVMSLVLVIFALRDLIPAWVFLPLFALWTLNIFRFGIGNHLPGYKSDTYLNWFTWLSAIAINVFGTVVLSAYLITTVLSSSK
jgi:hypothetical protein